MNDQAHCKNCRWWTAPERNLAYGECQLTILRFGTEAYPQSLAVANAEEDGACQATELASLVTDPEFGCVQFEVSDAASS